MRIIEELNVYPPIHKIFELFKDEKNAVFLDSSLQNNLGNYSIIGLYPYLELVNGEQFRVNQEVCDSSFENFVKDYITNNKDMNESDLPIVSGAIGYFSYDYGRNITGISSCHTKDFDVPDCILCFYDVFIIEDHNKNKLSLVANGHREESQKQINSLKKTIGLLRNSRSNLSELTEFDSYDIQIESNFTKNDYMKAVADMIHYIEKGDINIVNMTRQLKIKSLVKPYDFFKSLRKLNPSPFGGYLNYESFQIISASPERFLQMQDSIVVTRPIKGTRKRGTSIEEDNLLRNELLNSKKDKTELGMIVDLEQNDLNKVCIKGSVKVTERFTVEEYATVFHLVSNIEGILRKNKNVMDLIEATFPGGSITGAPKESAMKRIDQIEHGRRNLYTGSFGYITLDGRCDLNTIIRTAIYHKGCYHVGIGGGITRESDLEFEYEETLQKAKAILDSLAITLRE